MSNRTFDSDADHETFQKIRREADGMMPVASNRRARVSSRKTAASRRANRKIAKRTGGIHKRRIKKIT